MKNNYENFTHFLILVAILSFGLLFYFLNIGNPKGQFIVGTLLSLSYFLWGVVSHYHKGDLHLKIVVEYLLIALLAFFLLKGAN